MHKHIIGLIFVNILNTGTALADSCPETISITQLSSLNTDGQIIINDVLFDAIDRENIKAITPSIYHLSSWTALAKLRKSEIIDNHLSCHYGYKSSVGNVTAKLDNSPKEALNEKYDYTFTIRHQLSTIESPVTTTTETTIETVEKDVPTDDSLNKSSATTTTEIKTETITELPPIETIVITKEEIAKNINLRNNLELLNIKNLKVTEKIVDLQYKLLVAQANSNSIDLTEINQAYEYIKQYFVNKHNQL